jgi:hypothetical protein
LTPKENQLTGIDLVGRRSDVEIRLDKRVYNVGQNLNAKGTNVSDVLENIPSLSLDLEGNLELRGSTNVRILIDGKTIWSGWPKWDYCISRLASRIYRTRRSHYSTISTLSS